jgi:hypothetical protein
VNCFLFDLFILIHSPLDMSPVVNVPLIPVIWLH